MCFGVTLLNDGYEREREMVNTCVYVSVYVREGERGRALRVINLMISQFFETYRDVVVLVVVQFDVFEYIMCSCVDDILRKFQNTS